MAQVISAEPKRPNSKLISAIVATIILVVGIFVGVYIIQNQTNTPSEAQLASDPLQIEVSNITDSSFTLSWVTAEAVTGTLSYGEDEEVSFVARDKRDLYDDRFGQYVTHYIQVVGLSPNRRYYYRLTSGGKKFDDNGSLYEITTGPNIAIPTSSNAITAYGGITSDTNKPAEGAIVLVSNENMQTVSTITDNQGKWSINLAAARTPDVKALATFSDTAVATIRVQGAKKNSSVRVAISQLAPAPAIQLGKSYDLSQVSSVSSNNADSKFDFINTLGAQEATRGDTLTIWSPQENESIATTRPLFIGSAPASTTISLTLDPSSTGIASTVASDSRGNWQWSAPSPLGIGAHIFKVSYINSQKVTIEVQRTFMVEQTTAGQPAFESSPSATLTRSPSPTRSPSKAVTPTIVATVTTTPSATTTLRPEVTYTPVPTKVPTSTPTGLTVTPTETSEISLTPTPTKAQLPRAGVAAPTLAIGISALMVLLVAGLMVI